MRTIYASAALSAAAYYTRYLTDAPGEVPGVWTGDQAVGLGLAGEVDGDDLLAVLQGRDPGSGTPLGRLLTDRTLANGRVVKAVAGFDATFSAPKSLSVLWALTQDDRLLAAHDTAVRAALAHLERFGSTTRVRRGGRLLHPDSQGLTMAMFRQTTSRSDDPQLHTHVVISAKVQTDDGRWLALDARYLKQYQRMLGGLYQSVLRNELAHRFGIGWEPIVHGQAEILGVPEELREVFSKRSEQIEHAVAAKVAEFVGRQTALRSKGRHKRRAQNDARTATADRAAAQDRKREIEELAAPAREEVYAAANEVHQLEQSLRSQDVLDRWHNPHTRADHLRELHAAVYDWQQWAAGKPIPLDRITTIAATLRAADDFAGTQPLADVLHQWAAMNGVEIGPPQVSTQGPSIELGL